MSDRLHPADLEDIQGIVIRGYGYMPAAEFVLMQVKDGGKARAWLQKTVERVTPGHVKPQDGCLNIAITHEGLTALGVSEEIRATFALEFREGMTTTHRQRILGDTAESAPENWRWGTEGKPAHILLMIYAPDSTGVQKFYESICAGDTGLAEVARLGTILLPARKEHFGFRDGIAQPRLRGLEKPGQPPPPADNTLNVGEILLGYKNEYDKFSNSPSVDAASDPKNILSPAQPTGTTHRDLGRNGSYLVYRQLKQDVAAFWRFLDKVVDKTNGEHKDARIAMAAKMVGRWPSGAPLVLCPEADDPAFADRDDFGYHAQDAHGDRCPLGAHIRRSNPRDALGGDPKDSIVVGNRHRILRRGRAYGDPLPGWMREDGSIDPEMVLQAKVDSGERGLHFICLNANLARQFEFVQHTWVNNPKFAGQYADPDPITGDNSPDSRGLTGTFTVQQTPVRKRITGVPRFVSVVGGAYFFLPGIRALRFLATSGQGKG